MIPKELAEQVQAEAQRIKEVQDQFLQTYQRLCGHLGGPEWQRSHSETKVEAVFHHARREIVPIMERAGMDDQAVQALCAWAEKLLMRR
jgi:hypothetical protein